MDLWRKIEEALFRLVRTATSVCLAVLLVLLSGQVVSRFLNIPGLAPYSEIIDLFFGWFVFLGAALLVRQQGHIRVDLVEGVLRARPRVGLVYRIAIEVLMLTFLVPMTQSAWAVYRLAQIKRSPELQWPDTLWFACLVVSSLLMLGYTLARLVRTCGELRTVRPVPASEG